MAQQTRVRRVSVILMLLLLVGLAAGCGGSKPQPAKTSPPAAQVQAAVLSAQPFEWKPDGIDITVFAPPPIDTPLTQAEVGVMAQAGVGMKKLAGELKIDDAVKSMLKGVEKRQFLVVPGMMANLIRLQLRFLPVSWVNWIGNKTVAFSLRKQRFLKLACIH